MQISVRDLTENDVPLILHYWYHSPAGFIESIGVDFEKLLPEPQMESLLREKCEANAKLEKSKINALIITGNGEPIGFHTLGPLTEGDHGIFHAHLWNTQLRGKGIGQQSYIQACRIFMERFDLQRILFKTPKQNIGAIRVKEKLGIRYIGEELIGFGIIKNQTPAKVFELTREELEKCSI